MSASAEIFSPLTDYIEGARAAGTLEAPHYSLEGLTYDDIKNRHPNWPELHLHIHYSPHETAVDFAGVQHYLQHPATRPDIYLMECMPVSETRIAAYQIIARQPMSHAEDYIDDNNLHETHSSAAIRGLAGSGSAIGSIDLNGHRPYESHLGNIITTQYKTPIEAQTFGMLLLNTVYRSQQRAEAQREREWFMLQHFESEIEFLLAENPELAQKPRLNIFLTLGAIHTTAFHDFQQAGFCISRSFSRNPYIYNHETELERLFMLRAPLYARQLGRLAAKAYVEGEVQAALYLKIGRIKSNTDKNIYLRHIARQIDVSDVQDVFNAQSSAAIHKLMQARKLARLPFDNQSLRQHAETIAPSRPRH